VFLRKLVTEHLCSVVARPPETNSIPQDQVLATGARIVIADVVIALMVGSQRIPGVVALYYGILRDGRAAEQNVPGQVIAKIAVVEQNVTFHVEEAVQQCCGIAIPLKSHAEAVEDDVLYEEFLPLAVLDIAIVTVTTIGAHPAVVVNDIAVEFRVRGVDPALYSFSSVVDDVVYNLDVSTEDIDSSGLPNVRGP
jgi:hypothetical protein